ncbi:nucleotidyltransferase domain-containing protein [Candidatus Woesearchaeota archaeon]|nr:nucleotidyltransferase domain-containing protein [Candidatus Woesearchaeota archaeon]
MEILRNVGKWGNSAGVLLPKEWIGKEVTVILIDRTNEIKKEVFDILSPYLEDIIGIYLVGSYARNEPKKNSDIDIMIISQKTKKEIFSGKYSISISPLESIKKTLEKNPLMVYPRLIEAKTILNKSLLEELSSKKPKKKDFYGFIQDTKRIIKINKEALNQKSKFVQKEVIYSLILRLRGIFIINCILKNKKYTNHDFEKMLEKNNIDCKNVYEVYSAVKSNKKTKIKINVSEAEKLLELLQLKIKNQNE